MGAGVGTDDGERERQARARLDERGGGLRLRRHPMLPDAAAEQTPGLVGVGQVHRHDPRPVRRRETQEPIAARDDRQRRGRSGQQRTYLLGVAGVVQQQKHAPVRQNAPIQARLALRRAWNAVWCHAQRLEQDPDRFGGRQRRP
ncbi:hypothetical protein Ais01nite_64980 [Asanoa ishikariensis]|nr:hypothetical protein Ais01nite_64980 [Asanoa ishikariensis]